MERLPLDPSRPRKGSPLTLGPVTVIRPERGEHRRMSVTPRYRHYCERCTCLGQATINERTADLFVCDDLVVARYGDEPGESEAEHIHSLKLETSPFLLLAYRLFLDRSGQEAVSGRARHPAEPIQS